MSIEKIRLLRKTIYYLADFSLQVSANITINKCYLTPCKYWAKNKRKS